MSFKPVNPKASFPELEKEILSFWKKEKVFEKSLEKPAPSGTFVFYEGPPTANGKPGLHHVLARAFKDVMPRYKTMRGFNVPRKAGWDTHGLPVEIEVEKKLGISGKQDIEKIKGTKEESIIEFNRLCKESVWTYKKEWEDLTRRMGFWLDMEHPYITYENNYIESVWWVVSQAFKKGLFFKGHKIVPYCPRCGTALSSHELAQGYKEVEDKSIYIKFKVKKDRKIGGWTTDDDTYFLVWTTTPWTLPGNVALAVNENLDYIITTKKTGVVRESPIFQDVDYLNSLPEHLILASSGLDHSLGNDIVNYEKTKIIKGSELLGLEYDQLFPFIIPDKKAFFVISGDFVSDSNGTGIVHIAPAYGEEDYIVGKENDLPVLMTLDKEGKMLSEITPWAGKGAKESDPEIIDELKNRNPSLIYKVETIKHDYPFCWRCDTALLYYAKDSWFIEMTKLKDELVKNNEGINWVPENIKHGRFGEWLEGVKDWAISRDRYWGSPLPIWICDKCGKQKCISSIEELKSSKDFNLTYPSDESLDLHRPYIDKITFACDCSGVMTRVPEVMDVWLDSGTMPYSQLHYPFQNKELIDEGKFFPADYICEAVDQTRGWFYTLHAISTFLGLGNSFKHVICLGHILDSKGQKMSKSKGNILDPIAIADTHGFDAIRWYMYTNNQPGEPKLVSEEAIKDQVRRFLLILWNIYSFFVNHPSLKDFEKKFKPFYLNKKISIYRENLGFFDSWLISRKNQTIKKVTESLENYDIFTAARSIEEFVMDLSTKYLRRRKTEMDDPFAQVTFYETIMDTVRLLAPFTPFISEEIFRNINIQNRGISVHLEKWPESKSGPDSLIDEFIENRMAIVQKIIELGHFERKKAQIKVRQPLSSITIGGYEHKQGDTFRSEIEGIIKKELNVENVIWSQDKFEEIEIKLDTEITDDLKQKGYMREIVRLIQDARKEAKYSFSDQVKCYFQTDSQKLKNILTNEIFNDIIKKQAVLIEISEGAVENSDIEKEAQIGENGIKIYLLK